MSNLFMLGAEREHVGFDYSTLVQTIGNLGGAGVAMYESNEKENKDKTDSAAKLQAAKDADNAAAIAAATAANSASLAAAPGAKPAAKDKADADKQAADIVDSLRVKAVNVLSTADNDKRVAYDQEQLALAVKKYQADSKSAYAKNLVNAWKLVIAGGGGAPSAAKDGKDGKGAGGPGMPGWKIGAIVGGSAVGLTGLGLLIWRLVRRKVGV